MLWVPGSAGTFEEQAKASVTTGGTSSTKGTPAQIIASTARDSQLLIVTAYGYALAATACQMAFDILVGASTESVLIANLLGGHAGLKVWAFPIHVPAGTRVAAQAAGARTSTAFTVHVRLVSFQGGAPFRVAGEVTTYGMGTVPSGTSITPGASGAEGSFAQITASSTKAHFGFLHSFQVSADTTTNLRNIEVDLGIGAATEDVPHQNASWMTTANEEMAGFCWPLLLDVPASTRLSMRASNNGTNDGAYNGVIHALS